MFYIYHIPRSFNIFLDLILKLFHFRFSVYNLCHYKYLFRLFDMQCIIICHCNPSKHWQHVCYVILKDRCLCRMIYRTTDFVLNAPFTSLDQILSHTCKTSEHQQLWLIRLSLNIILPLNSSACAVLNKKLSPRINTDHALYTQHENGVMIFCFSCFHPHLSIQERKLYMIRSNSASIFVLDCI